VQQKDLYHGVTNSLYWKKCLELAEQKISSHRTKMFKTVEQIYLHVEQNIILHGTIILNRKKLDITYSKKFILFGTKDLIFNTRNK
jgi:hypothetical protein